MLEKIKRRLGIHASITIYDDEIMDLIEDVMLDMMASGVPSHILHPDNVQAQTAVTYYVKANFGNDRTDTNRYTDLYRKKVFRLTLEDA